MVEKNGVKGVWNPESGQLAIIDTGGQKYFAGPKDGPIPPNEDAIKNYLIQKVGEFLSNPSNFSPDHR